MKHLIFILLISAFSSSAQTWSQKSNFPSAVRYGAIGEVVSGIGYVGSGYDGFNNLKDFWKFDPTSGIWSQLANIPGPDRRNGISFVANDNIYFGHGWTGSAGLSDFYKYDPITNTWDTIPPFPFTTSRNAIGMELDNRGYVAGGSAGTVYMDTLYEYDPFINIWTSKSPFPFGGRSALSGISYNGLLYIGLGRNGSNSFKDFWSFSPITNTWTNLLDFPGVKRMHAEIFIQDNKIVVGSGYRLGLPNLLTDYYQYDPIQGTWSPYTTPAFSKRALAAILEFPGDDTYIVSGWDTFENECNEVWNYGLNVSIPSNSEISEHPLVYPNPAQTKIKVMLQTNNNALYSIYSLQGVQLDQGFLISIENTIDCTKLSSGTYILKVNNGGKNLAEKFSIQN